MKRAVYINSDGYVFFLLTPARKVSDGNMLSLPPSCEMADTCLNSFSNSIHILYGFSIDFDKYTLSKEDMPHKHINKMCDSYHVVDVINSETSGSKYPWIWLNKNDLRNMRAANTLMLKDHYKVIEDVFHALI